MHIWPLELTVLKNWSWKYHTSWKVSSCHKKIPTLIQVVETYSFIAMYSKTKINKKSVRWETDNDLSNLRIEINLIMCNKVYIGFEQWNEFLAIGDEQIISIYLSIYLMERVKRLVVLWYLGTEMNSKWRVEFQMHKVGMFRMICK